MQGITQMLGQPARHHQDSIEAPLVIGVAGMAADPVLGRPGNTGGLPSGKCRLSVRSCPAPLDLDEGDTPPAQGNQVDFAVGCAHAPAEDAVALGDQECGSYPFGQPAALVAYETFGVGWSAAHAAA